MQKYEGLVKNTKRIVTAESKQKALITSLAIRLARQMGDPLYDKYKFDREKLKMDKKEIVKKYGPLAMKILKERGLHLKITLDDLVG